MDSSESKDGMEAGVNSLSRPLRCHVQSPRREFGRVSPARRLTMSRGELNRERDDASASGGGAGAAHEDPAARGRVHAAKVLGAFAGSKNDGAESLPEQRFLAAKGCENDGAEFLGTKRMFLAAKGPKNDGAEFLGTGRRFLAAKGSKNDGAEFLYTGRTLLAAKGIKNDGAEAEAEAEEVLGAFAGSKKANTVKAVAAAERIDGAVLGALAEKAAAAFFQAIPAVPHAVNLTEKDLKVKEPKNVAKVQEEIENKLHDDLLWKCVETNQRTEKAQELAKAEIAPAATEQRVPRYENMDEAYNKDLKVKELKNCAEMQEKTENELEDDLLWNDTAIATSKGLDASSKKSESVTIPHPLCERATIELVKTNKIQDVNSVQNWLLEKERESDENIMIIGTDEEKKVWQRVRACPNVFGQKFSGRRLTSLKVVTNRKDILFLYQQMQRSGSTFDIREIAHPSMQGLSEIIKFLCRNCLLRNGKADRLALEMLCEAVKDTADAEVIGDLPGFVATVVLRSYIGNAESQRLSLQILILLSRRYRNKLKIIKFGGFSTALWHVSQRHAMMGCQLMASLMDAEEGFMKFIKDGASFDLVSLAVKTSHLTPCISAVIEGLRDFPLGRTKFIEAVGSLPSKEVFVQQRLTWCLLDFVEEDERYCHDDTLED